MGLRKLTKAERETVRQMFDGKCAYCGCDLPERWHADHVEPVWRQPGELADERIDRAVYEAARHVGIPADKIQAFIGTLRMCEIGLKFDCSSASTVLADELESMRPTKVWEDESEYTLTSGDMSSIIAALRTPFGARDGAVEAWAIVAPDGWIFTKAIGSSAESAWWRLLGGHLDKQAKNEAEGYRAERVTISRTASGSAREEG